MFLVYCNNLSRPLRVMFYFLRVLGSVTLLGFMYDLTWFDMDNYYNYVSFGLIGFTICSILNKGLDSLFT